MNLIWKLLVFTGIAASSLGPLAPKALADDVGAWGKQFRVSSTTFVNDGALPLSTLHNLLLNGQNSCTVDGNAGGNLSPELSWTGAPPNTKTFVVVAYDTTAAFTHWGMYNVPASTTELPQGAGLAGSHYGKQIFNDFFAGAQYDGPCPPAGIPPEIHRYRFTVYALDGPLALRSEPNFPANAETLYHALIDSGRYRHILATASITGIYSSTPPSN